MSKFIKVNRFTGYKIVWDKAEPGARAVEETGRKIGDSILVGNTRCGTYGAPMLTSEAETFVDMQNRGSTWTRDIANEYRIE